MSATKSHAPALIAVFIGATAGVVRYADDVTNHGRRFAALAMVTSVSFAGFSGWLVAEIAATTGRSSWAYAAAGVGGLLGGNVTGLVLGAIRQYLHIDRTSKDPE